MKQTVDSIEDGTAEDCRIVCTQPRRIAAISVAQRVAEERGEPFVHRASWPAAPDFEGVAPPADTGSFALAAACLGAINKAKSDASVSMGREVSSVVLVGNPKTLERLDAVLPDVLLAARCQSYQLRTRDSVADDGFEVEDAVFAERPGE